MDFDPVLLARIQFAFTVAFHIIFPAFTIGLSAWIAVLEFRWLRSGDERLHRLARFWTKIFAVSFAMGVVSGIVLSYQLGTNWSRYSEVLGNVVGPLLGYEVLTAFFLEASFLGVMLFGWNRVPKWLHFTASVAVAVGTLISAFWILSANSWMQYPTGYEMRNGIAYPVDWLAIVFNPTFPLRFLHMVTACYLTTAFVVLSLGARYLLQDRFDAEAKTMVRWSLGLICVLAPAQLVIGDFHGLDTAKYQPAKLAAIEAHWDGSKPAPFVIFALPNEAAERNDFEIAIPNVASFLITHDWNGRFKGLKDFRPEDRPPVAIVFFSFRLMVGVGLLMILAGFLGAFLWWRRKLFAARWYLWPLKHAWPAGFVAILAGWITTEVGRQPWVATGILRTKDAVSPVPGGSIAVTLLLFVVVYGIVFSAGIYYINRLMRKGPSQELIGGDPSKQEGGTLAAAAEEG